MEGRSLEGDDLDESLPPPLPRPLPLLLLPLLTDMVVEEMMNDSVYMNKLCRPATEKGILQRIIEIKAAIIVNSASKRRQRGQRTE